jgi:peptide/nickel transport system permease protein
VAKRRLGIGFFVAAGFVALVVLAALLASVLPLVSPTKVFAGPPLAGPSLAHPFGTDELGRDLASRVVFGARVSLVVGAASIAIGLLIGGTLGVLSGFVGGLVDRVLNAGSYVALSFPTLLALIAVVAFWGQSLGKLTIVIGAASIAPLYRVVRAATMQVATREFVLASRSLGATTRRILVREILPNVLPAALSVAIVGVAVVIVVEGSLAFLGLSVALPTPSWGNMIAEGRDHLGDDPWIVIWPSLCIFALVLALNYLGDRLAIVLDVREARL